RDPEEAGSRERARERWLGRGPPIDGRGAPRPPPPPPPGRPPQPQRGPSPPPPGTPATGDGGPPLVTSHPDRNVCARSTTLSGGSAGRAIASTSRVSASQIGKSLITGPRPARLMPCAASWPASAA